MARLVLASADNDTGGHLLDLLAAGAVTVQALEGVTVHVADPAGLLLLALAVVTICCGAVWAGRDFQEHLTREHARARQSAMSSAGDNDADGSHMEEVTVTVPAVLTFVAAATVMMFVLFFTLNRYIFYVFVAIFAYGSCVATAVCVHGLLSLAAPQPGRVLWAPRAPHWCTGWRVTYVDAAAVATSGGLVLLWLLNRHAAWAWVPQNVLGVCFMVMALRSIHLPDGRVATLFLLLLFVYDVFMVFVTPLFMPNGDSVMVRVAKGGAANEVMPMLLVVPRMLPPLHSGMMLGYGDVVVPGLLVALLRRFDVGAGRALRRGYMLPVLVAYVVGLLLTDVALEYQWGGSQGQPALLYLVPCTLGAAWALAWWRGDAAQLWGGVLEDAKDHDSGTEEGGEEAAGVGQASWSRARNGNVGGGDVAETARLV